MLYRAILRVTQTQPSVIHVTHNPPPRSSNGTPGTSPARFGSAICHAVSTSPVVAFARLTVKPDDVVLVTYTSPVTESKPPGTTRVAPTGTSKRRRCAASNER